MDTTLFQDRIEGSDAPPLGVIDVGSNSIKLLVARSIAGKLQVLSMKTLQIRISKGITGIPPRISPDSIEEGTQGIKELVHLAREHQCQEIRIVATSAVRDAENGKDFQENVSATTGLPLHILSGKEEAETIAKALLLDSRIQSAPQIQVVDLGGGSLEYMFFNRGTVTQTLSYKLGCVRLTEEAALRNISQKDPSFKEWVQTRVLQELQTPPGALLLETPLASLWGTGGSLFNIQQLVNYNGGSAKESISTELLVGMFNMLAPLSLEERRQIPGIQKERADILPTAIATFLALCTLGKQPVIFLSSLNLRIGIAARILNPSSIEYALF